MVSNPSPRLLEDHQMLLSDFLQEDFSFPANLSSTIQVCKQTLHLSGKEVIHISFYLACLNVRKCYSTSG